MSDRDHVTVSEMIDALGQFSADSEVYVETDPANLSIESVEWIEVTDKAGEKTLLVALKGV